MKTVNSYAEVPELIAPNPGFPTRFLEKRRNGDLLGCVTDRRRSDRALAVFAAFPRAHLKNVATKCGGLKSNDAFGRIGEKCSGSASGHDRLGERPGAAWDSRDRLRVVKASSTR